MKKMDIGQTINTFANVGALAGIIFLVVQIGQNNSLLESEARSTRVQIRTDGWNTLVDSPDMASMLIKDRSGETLSGEEEFRLNSFWMTTLWRNQWEYEEYGPGPWITVMRAQFAVYGSLRRTWRGDGSGARTAGKDNFPADFVRIIDEQVLGQP